MLTERSARVAAAVKLHRHVARRRAGRFLAEGLNLVEAASARGLVRDVFVTESAAAAVLVIPWRSPVAGSPGDRTRRKGAVRHRDSGRAGRGVRDAVDSAGGCAGRLTAAGCGSRRDQRAGQRGHGDPHRRCDGGGGCDPGRAQRRPLQRQVPARFRGQHLLDSGRRRARCSRRRQRVARRRAAGAGDHGGR